MKHLIIALILSVVASSVALAECPCKRAATKTAACPCEMTDGVCSCQP